MGKFVNNVDEFFTFCKENEVQFVDLRFTDIKGACYLPYECCKRN